MESAVTGNGGKVEELQTLGHTATIEKDDDVTIGKYNGEIETRYIEQQYEIKFIMRGEKSMIFIAIIIGCILGAILGLNAPMISYTYSSYLAIAIIAALDSVFGGIASVIKKNFDLKIFISGFFGNAILAILLTILGQKLNVDIYLAAIVVFVWRMFMNLGTIRRYYVEKWSDMIKERATKKSEKETNKEEKEQEEQQKA